MKHRYLLDFQPVRSSLFRRVRALGVAAALLVAGASTASAQSLNYLPSGAQNAAGVYTDLGTAGTAIATADTDDSNSTPQEIGFTFNYNGQAFTQFILNTNGYIKLGAIPPANPALISPFLDRRTPADVVNIIAASTNVDLTGAVDQVANPTEYRVATTGAAGSRVCTVQFKNLTDFDSSPTALAQTTTIQFQIKLFEGSNNIELQYGSWTASANPAGTNNATSQPFLIGLIGSRSTPSNILVAAKIPTQAWSTTQFFSDGYYGHYTSNAFLPDAGRTYRFRPATVRDDASVAVYTLGELPATAASPHQVTAAVTNNGFPEKTNVPVTLTVTGANTFTNTKTIPSIAPGQTVYVTFDPYPATLALGTNTVRATIPADAVASNNSSTYRQQVTGFSISYLEPGVSLQGLTAPAGFFLANKYFLTQATTVSEISTIVAPAAGNNAGFRLLLYDATGTNGSPGTALYTSPVLTRTPAGGEVSVLVPDVAVNGAFFVALEIQTTDPIIAFQVEDPLRANTYFIRSPGAQWFSLDNTDDLPVRLALEAKFTGACLQVRDVAVSNVAATSATVTFTPTAGAGTYDVEYGPRGFQPGSGTRVSSPTSPVNLTGLVSGGNYDVYVRKNCGAELAVAAGPVAFATPCTPGPVAALPYTETFDFALNSAVPCGFTVLDANADRYTWQVATGATINDPQYARSGLKSLIYLYNDANLTVGADDWVFTPALTLAAAQQYVLSFYNRVGVLPGTTQVVPEGLEIRVGTAPNPGAMTTTIFDNRNLNNPAFALRTTDPIRVPADGQYYVGFHVVSNPGAFILALDDLTISAGQTTSVNQALSQSIDAYPNPTTGMLSLNLSATNAHRMSATVVNMVGQTVYARSLTGKQAQLDLSNLAAGVYVLKLELDGETAVKRISIQK